MEVVASLSQARTAAAQCGLFAHKSVPVIFEPPCFMDKGLHPASWSQKTIIGYLPAERTELWHFIHL